MHKKLAAGNWKMNGLKASLSEIDALISAHPAPDCEVLICPPATLLAAMSEKTSGSPIATGAQDCHSEKSGAHTGDLSAEMIADTGAKFVILGHSERRADHGESDERVREKAEAAYSANLIAIICCGETLEEREAGETISVVSQQIAWSIPDNARAENTVVAYEPVWAIGTGKVATSVEIEAVHADIRARLRDRFDEDGDKMRILYGGSVKPSNADEIFAVPNVDGALVGGASLKAEDFGGIITALANA